MDKIMRVDELFGKKLYSLEQKNEVREFLETHLADLLDNGYNIFLSYEEHETITGIGSALAKKKLKIYFKKEAIENATNSFSWDDICDQFIPAFELLSRKEDIVRLDIQHGYGSFGLKSYTKNLNRVIKSDLGNNITNISFYIKPRKVQENYSDDSWTATSTNNKEYEYDFTSKDSIYHGIHPVNVSKNGVRATIKAKFDSGAKSSSIDFKVAKKLGLSDTFITTCKKLDSVDLSKFTKTPKNISLVEQRKIEGIFYKELKKSFPELSGVKLVKSSSGFSLRMVVDIQIEYNGRVISTDANVRDRTGLSCEMLVGLKDM